MPNSGAKLESSTDYSSGGQFPLVLTRYYSSEAFYRPFAATAPDTGMGLYWRLSYHRWVVAATGTAGTTMFVTFGNGDYRWFRQSGGVWMGRADMPERLTQLTDGKGHTTGWQFKTASDDLEAYDAKGRLLSITNRAGLSQVMSYDAQTRLTSVTDSFGRQLVLGYNTRGQIATLTDPAGGQYTYAYNAAGDISSISYPDQSVRQYLYEYTDPSDARTALHLMTGIVDENNNRFANYQYDTNGRLVFEDHGGGIDNRSMSYAFDFSGGVTSTTISDAFNVARIYTFALMSGISKDAGLSQPCPGCTGNTSKAIAYDANGNVSSRTDFNNKTICYAYDLSRALETARLEGALSTENCTTVLATPPNRPDVRKITTAWHPTYRLPATIVEPAPGGMKTTTFTYDGTGNLTQKSIVAPANDGAGNTITRTWNWSYSTLGRVLSATDPDSHTTTTTHYADNDPGLGKRGSVATITNAAGHVTQITDYDASGRPLSVADANGLITALGYDLRGRLTSRQVGTETTGYNYDGVGQLTQVTLPDSSYLHYTYDAAHRLNQINDGLGNKIVYALDAMGNRTGEATYDPANQLARMRSRTFDVLNRLASDLGAQNQTTSYTYDNNGNLLTSTDPLGHATGHIYDALNRLTQVLDPNLGTTTYTYDGANNLTQISDPRGSATSYTYDGLNNLMKLVSPDTGTTNNTYDAAGNLLTRADARSAMASYTYDVLNRVTQVVYSKSSTPSETHVFTYDSGANAKGRLSAVTDPAAITSWNYNSQGRVASKVQQVGSMIQTVAYSYNAAGQLTSITTPSGQQVGYGYTNNRISGITINGQSLLTGVNTKPFGPLSAWHWGNGLFTFRDYDTDGRLADWEFRNGSSILRKNQSFDAAGRIIAIIDPNTPAASQAYQYDVLDRLTVAQSGNPVTHTQQFSYDPVGNRQNATIDGAAANLSYAPTGNQLQQIAGVVSANYFNDATALTFGYNNANRLVQVQSSGVTVAGYAVNALGQRVSKTAAGVTTLFVYDEHGRLLGEYDGAGTLIQETVWLEDLPVATLRPTGTGNPTPIAIFYVHADHLGSPRAVTRPSDNAIMWQWDNVDPFGVNAANENPAGQGVFRYAMRFPGQYYDAETGTHYNYYRDYDSTIGRYEQSDPIGLAAGMNTYAYVEGKPIRFVDPRGLDRWGIEPYPGWEMPRLPGFHGRKPGDGGNLLPGYTPQDWLCSFPMGFLNSDRCSKACCIAHDACFEKYNCNWSSWLFPLPTDCFSCNKDAVACLFKAKTSGCGCATHD